MVEESIHTVDDYERIGIGFTVRSRLDVPILVASGGRDIQERPVTPWLKDYDACEEDRPTELIKRFDATHWGFLAAYDADRRVGGTILVWKTPEFNMLHGRDDLAVMVDIRVQDDYRGRGVGRALFQAAARWARARRCTELHVETQDTNVPACRFYRAMGCDLAYVESPGYGPDCDEAKIVWAATLES